MGRSSSRLVVDVKLLPEPCLWCWEIRDTRSGSVENSWERDWTAYESRQQAFTAGLERAALLAHKPPARVILPRPGRAERRRVGATPPH